ncbi:hypothetical protein [Leisingera sp. JC11]|uniref:hypothetical protein n=1 Tax=Leisingera sp. JC11 TaxID=3042469 RepID=UPI0034533E91
MKSPSFLERISTKFPSKAKIIFYFFVLLLPFGTVGASEKKLSFAEELGRPVTFTYFHPVPGLQKKLRQIDVDGEIAVETDWHPFSDGDVWVFFLLDEAEIEIMPIEVIRFLKNEGRLPRKPFSRLEVTYPDGSKKLLLIVMMKPFLKQGLETYRCKIAFTIKWAVSASPEELDEDVPMECP